MIIGLIKSFDIFVLLILSMVSQFESTEKDHNQLLVQVLLIQ